jgi:hypothetical protein
LPYAKQQLVMKKDHPVLGEKLRGSQRVGTAQKQ